MTTSPQTLETERVILRPFVSADAPFVLALVNEPGWLRYIGDKGVRNLSDAARYIEEGPQAMYQKHGFGLLVVTACGTGEPIGMCGLLKRDWLEDVDIGFAFLSQVHGQGYAFEAAAAVLAHAKSVYGLARVIAITSPDNAQSGRLLAKLGFRLEQESASGPNGDALKVYGVSL